MKQKNKITESRKTVMGLVHAKVILKNPRHSKIKPIVIDALVDSGALYSTTSSNTVEIKRD